MNLLALTYELNEILNLIDINTQRETHLQRLTHKFCLTVNIKALKVETLQFDLDCW